MTTECVVCGQPLPGDPEDDPEGKGPDRPICGECKRVRDFDDLLWQMDAADGELDREID